MTTDPPRPARSTTVPALGARDDVPRRWVLARLTSLAALLALCVVLVLDPRDGLFVLWRVIVPVLPLLFFVATGLWRNICPISAANQLPRVLGFTRAMTPPRVVRERGFLLGIALLAAIIPLRRVVLDHSGPATAALLVTVVLAAFLGGTLFAGKSGWCSTICPMLPIERFYGQTPFAVVRNTHCAPCVGCAKHCYDATPTTATGDDLRDDDVWWRGPRRLFSGAFPAYVGAYFLLPRWSPLATYLAFAAAALVGIAVFELVAALTRPWYTVHPAFFAALTINGFYFFGLPSLLSAAERFSFHHHLDAAVWPVRAALATATLWWLARTIARDRVRDDPVAPVAVTITPRVADELDRSGGIRFADHDVRIAPPPGTSILEAAELCDVALTGSCRVGMCGADPVAVLEGAEHLAGLGDEEARTLTRLGVPPHVRMACSARWSGSGAVCVSTDIEEPPVRGGDDPEPTASAIRSVVIIGNGIAGVTAAEEVRRANPECEIHVIGRESFPFYNRMAISRVVYDRTAMHGLAMRPDSWFDEQRITCWLNTHAQSINRGKRTITLATGEVLAWDRLILATGSRGNVPAIPGRDLEGVFVLREALDALALRAYVQRRGARRGAIVGGGLLGLEAAHALHRLGLQTTVLEGAPRLLPRFVDAAASDVLAAHFAREGVDVRCGVTVEAIVGRSAVEGVHLGARGHVPADVVVICAGIAPNVELARAAGIAVGRGVLVDAAMRTSAAGVYAAGDVAELEGTVVGLWSTAAEQAEVAAHNALGGDRVFEPRPPAAVLKGAGIELTSVGRIEPEPGDSVHRAGSPDLGTSSMVIVDRRGELAGAIMVGQPGLARLAVDALHGSCDPSALLAALGDRVDDAGTWSWPAPWPPPGGRSESPARVQPAHEM